MSWSGSRCGIAPSVHASVKWLGADPSAPSPEGHADASCSLVQRTPEASVKTALLQAHMDKLRRQTSWTSNGAELELPIRRQQSSSHTISSDTAAISPSRPWRA